MSQHDEQLARMWREVYRKIEALADERVERKIGRVIVGGKVSGGRLSGPIPASSLPDHAERHEASGDDPLAAESLGTNETNDALVLRPDGGGGVQWDSETPGGVSEITDLPTAEDDPDLVLRPDGSGGVAWGEGGGPGGVQELDDLSDVDTSEKDDGDVLTWNESASEWQAVEPTGGGGNGFDPSQPYPYITLYDSNLEQWRVTVDTSGNLATEYVPAPPPEPDLISITNLGSDATVDLPPEAQPGDLFIICIGMQNPSTTLSISGYGVLYRESGASLHGFSAFWRTLDGSEDGTAIVSGGGSRNAQGILYRNAQLHTDEFDVPIAQTITGEAGTFDAISNLIGVGHVYMAGANYASGNSPALLSSDTYNAVWNEPVSTNTRHRGYRAEVVGETAPVEFSWEGTGGRYGMGQFVIVPSLGT